MIGLKEMRRRKMTFALVAGLVGLVSYLILMINGLGLGLEAEAGSAIHNLDADALAYDDRSQVIIARSELDAAAIQRAAALDGVDDWAPLGFVGADYVDSAGSITSGSFFGYDPGTIAAPRVIDGEPLRPGDTDGLLADTTFMRTSGLSIGDTVRVSYQGREVDFTIRGEINQGTFNFIPAAYILRESWQTLRYGDNPASQSAASIVLLKGEGLPGAGGPGFQVVSRQAAFDSIEGVDGIAATIWAIRIFGYAIGAGVIAVFFYVMTLQKLPQVGLLKAIGAGNLFVVRQTVVQALGVGAIGLALSVPLAVATSRALSGMPDGIPNEMTTDTYVITSVAMLVTAVLGAGFAARKVASVDPIIALGQQQ